MKVIAHDTSHDIETEIGAGVTDVRGVVDGGAAGVPFDVAGGVGDEGLFFAREGVAEEEMAGGYGVGGGGGRVPWVAGCGGGWGEVGACSGEGHGCWSMLGVGGRC